MGRKPGFRGVYAVEWCQTAADDVPALPLAELSIGMSWCWRGHAQRLDPGAQSLWLENPLSRDNPRGRARSRMRRIALAPHRAAQPEPTPAASPDTRLADACLDTPPADSLVLTDGHRLYPARLLRDGPNRVLAVFDPLLPPPDEMLWISALDLRPTRPRRPAGVICFTPGTLIDTARGARAVEDLGPGDLLRTRDNGFQPLLWRGETCLSGAELYLHPDLRPVRIKAGALGALRLHTARARALPERDLLVSPGHRILLPAPAGIFGTDEALVRACDLLDGCQIRRDFAQGSVVYLHLMLARHEILLAEGLPCESFHPGLAGAEVLKWHARALERSLPGLVGDPQRYGPPARPCLEAGHAALLRHALA
ncbi:MAG: Hint domain-containing protein [Pararhodobacter sp.]